MYIQQIKERKQLKQNKTKQYINIYIKHRTNFLVCVVMIETTVTVCVRCFVLVCVGPFISHPTTLVVGYSNSVVCS